MESKKNKKRRVIDTTNGSELEIYRELKNNNTKETDTHEDNKRNEGRDQYRGMYRCIYI